MANLKRKVALSTLGKTHIQENLTRFYPFLKKEFRRLKLTEIKKVEVFKELFGKEVEVNLEWLRAIYKFQQCDIKHKQTSDLNNSDDTKKK